MKAPPSKPASVGGGNASASNVSASNIGTPPASAGAPKQKPWRSFEEQAQMMLDRGLIGERDVIIGRLQYVNYYRLLGYSFRYRRPGDPTDSFVAGTTFDRVWDDYVFDQKLRVLMMEAIERIEVAARTQIAYWHAKEHGPTGYADNPNSLPNLKARRRASGHEAFLSHAQRCLVDSRQQAYLKSFARKHAGGRECGDGWPPPWPPIWVTCETLSIGNIVVMYQGCHDRERERIANEFRLTSGEMESWLLMYQLVRNICAHHSRLWNKPITKSPKKPAEKAFPGWYKPLDLGASQKVFGALTATACMLSVISPGSSWVRRIKDLLAEHPAIPLADMGFPVGWETSPLWT